MNIQSFIPNVTFFFLPDCPTQCVNAKCAQTCTCIHQNSDSCNYVDGTCVCNPGFNGTNCESGISCQILHLYKCIRYR